jgi:hypothetical protein
MKRGEGSCRLDAMQLHAGSRRPPFTFVRLLLRVLTLELLPASPASPRSRAPPAAPPPDPGTAGLRLDPNPLTLVGLLVPIALVIVLSRSATVAGAVAPAPVPALAEHCSGLRELDAGEGLARGLGRPLARLRVQAGGLWCMPPPPVIVRVESPGTAGGELRLSRDTIPARGDAAPSSTELPADPLAFVHAAAASSGVTLTVEGFTGAQLPALVPGGTPVVWEFNVHLSGRATFAALRGMIAHLDAGPWLVHVADLEAELGPDAGAFRAACTLVSGP